MKQSQHDLFWRESWLWCVRRVFSSLAGLNSVFGNALQNPTQLFFWQDSANDQILCHEGVWEYPSWISLSGDSVFSHQQGVYGFKSPKRFFEISSQLILRPDYPIIGARSLCICTAQCLLSSSQIFPTVGLSDCCLQGIQPCKCKGEGCQWIGNQVFR